MVASLETSYHTPHTGPGWLHGSVNSAFPQGLTLRRVLRLVSCSAVFILKFLIIFNKEPRFSFSLGFASSVTGATQDPLCRGICVE